jgi:hypothetical protein
MQEDMSRMMDLASKMGMGPGAMGRGMMPGAPDAAAAGAASAAPTHNPFAGMVGEGAADRHIYWVATGLFEAMHGKRSGRVACRCFEHEMFLLAFAHE